MKIKSRLFSFLKIVSILLLLFVGGLIILYYSVSGAPEPYQARENEINDVTRLTSITVKGVEKPKTIEEIASIVKKYKTVSVGGGRYSMGGQTASEDAVHIDMRGFNKIISFSKEKKEITIQTGITWRKIQEFIDPLNLSVKIMQTYSNFTVGGSLSVNVHGRYIGYGPLIYSVKSIKVVLANGEIISASPEINREIFYSAIGGYGGIGVIAEATLVLDENIKVERQYKLMKIDDYKNYFFEKIRDDSSVVFHNANIYPGEYNDIMAVSYQKTDKDVTVKERLIPEDKDYRPERFAMWVVSEMPFGKWIRQNLLDPYFYSGEQVEWRNYEASYDVKELEPSSRTDYTYVLQEYFIPVEHLNNFVPKMAEIFNRHEANIINVSIRHAKKDPGSLLAWAKSEVFAFVVYYKQGTTAIAKDAVAVWTRELIDAATELNGSYYLPYQIHATNQQFNKAYPNSTSFFEIKKKYDPENKFRNKLWDTYYIQEPDTNGVEKKGISRFQQIYSNHHDCDGIYLFLQNVYGLYPTAEFQNLIKTSCAKYNTDEEIYKNIQNNIGSVTPLLWSFRYALPSLNKQKDEIARQTHELIKDKKIINGYLEVGTTGRYVNSLNDYFQFEGNIYLTNDTEPSYAPSEIIERGQLTKVGNFFNLNDYAAISTNQIPDTCLDLVTIYIGLHHAPSEKLNDFMVSINRVLRPGGKLIIRDHDVTSNEFSEFVSGIHDVFYSGLGMSWDFTKNEIRNFISADSLSSYVGTFGFKGNDIRLLQANDPSKNTMMVFTKTKEVVSALPKGYYRDEAQTYLTLPEWYLVYSPDEYAQYLKFNLASGFPYYGSFLQFWEYYGDIYNITKGKYDFNWGYHLMVFVIGTSYTVENSIKGLYEHSVGRITEYFSAGQTTEEDSYAAKIAQEYVDFIKVKPWYEFSFFSSFVHLWTEPSFFGKNFIRKIERKMILSNEYCIKAIYGYLIKIASNEVYGIAEEEVYAKVYGKTGSSNVMIEQPDSSYIIALPRYEKFKSSLLDLIKAGVRFDNICGNDEILISCIVPKTYQFKDREYGEVLIERDILTMKNDKRIGINAKVDKLEKLIPQLLSDSIFIEHIYEY